MAVYSLVVVPATAAGPVRNMDSVDTIVASAIRHTGTLDDVKPELEAIIPAIVTFIDLAASQITLPEEILN